MSAACGRTCSIQAQHSVPESAARSVFKQEMNPPLLACMVRCQRVISCLWVQLLEESRVYQVIPFMTHLELNHIKDDKQDAERAHKGQEAAKMVNAGLQPEYKGRFKLQVQPHCPALRVYMCCKELAGARYKCLQMLQANMLVGMTQKKMMTQQKMIVY